MKKRIDPKETYIVREVFGCGEGHCIAYGNYTHWEHGEACPYEHSSDASNTDVHLYNRLVLVAEYGDDAETKKLWDMMHDPKNENVFIHLPIAPEGLAIGTKVGPKEE